MNRVFLKGVWTLEHSLFHRSTSMGLTNYRLKPPKGVSKTHTQNSKTNCFFLLYGLTMSGIVKEMRSWKTHGW